MKHRSLWLMYKAFEIYYFMDVNFPSISLFTVLEQLGIGGSSRVVAVIGWCRLDHCNSHIVSNRFLWCSQRWNDLELKDSVESPLNSLKLWTKRILAFVFFVLKLPKACCPRQSCPPFSQLFFLPPFNHLLTEVGSRTPLLSTYQAQFTELKLYFLESLPIWSPH
jgi:hypothetical protein